MTKREKKGKNGRMKEKMKNQIINRMTGGIRRKNGGFDVKVH